MGGRSYRPAMTSLNIDLARDDVATGVGLVPATVPDSWTGGASAACQTQLDTLRTLLTGLDSLLDTADTAMTALKDESAG